MPLSAAVLPAIRPISDLRTNLHDVCEQARESREPIVMTKNGSPALVVMDSSAYEEQRQRDRVYLALREAEIESKFESRLVSKGEADAGMKQLFASWGIDYDRN